MAKRNQTEDAFINSLVGEGTHFKGDLQLNGLFRIDGDFTGTITTKDKVLIGKKGRADCIINAGTVVVGGVFRGSIYSEEKVIVLSSAVVIGNIYAPRLIVEEGVLIDGSFVINRELSVAPSEKSMDSDSHGKKKIYDFSVAAAKNRNSGADKTASLKAEESYFSADSGNTETSMR
jgi:cytoskeletal protein CcmA (bactofilin family)